MVKKPREIITVTQTTTQTNEHTMSDKLNELINGIKVCANYLFAINIPDRAISDIAKALKADEIKVGRLPTLKECKMMMVGDDEDEDVIVVTEFMNTLSELESFWQLK